MLTFMQSFAKLQTLFKVFKVYIQTCMQNMFSKSKIFDNIGAYSYEIKFILEYE